MDKLMEQAKTTKQVLIEARALLVEKGWVPYSGSSDLNGPNCIVTAIDAVTPSGLYIIIDAFNAMQKVISNASLDGFNDRQSSIEPVLAKFDEAIALLKD